MHASASTKLYEAAREDFLAGRLHEARRQLESGLAVDRDAGRLWELLGCIMHTLGCQDRAVECLEQASLLVPLDHASRFVLALCYEQQGRALEAVDIYRFLSDRNDLEEEVLEPLARALGRAADFEAALSVCLEAAERQPDCPGPLMGAVFYMRQLRRPAGDMLPLALSAHRLDLDDVECRVSLAWLLHECGRSEEGAGLLRLINLKGLHCNNCMSRMRAVFRSAGDAEYERRCAERQLEISENES